MRNELARHYGAEATCPLSTGIFLRIVAEAALEELSTKSISEITPFWRMIDAKSTLAKKMGLSEQYLNTYRAMNDEDEVIDFQKT